MRKCDALSQLALSSQLTLIMNSHVRCPELLSLISPAGAQFPFHVRCAAVRPANAGSPRAATGRLCCRATNSMLASAQTAAGVAAGAMPLLCGDGLASFS